MPVDEPDLAPSDRGLYRKISVRGAVAGGEDRVWAFGLLLACGSARGVEDAVLELLDLQPVSFRRIAKRSDSDPRDALLESEMPGEEVCGATRNLSTGALVMLSVPARLPMLGLEASDGCGSALVENELDRSGLKLRALGALGAMLVEGARLAGGVNEGRDGTVGDGAAWNDLPAPKEGLEGREGADLGWLNEGLGRLNEGLG